MTAMNKLQNYKFFFSTNRSDRLRSNCTKSDSSNVGCMNRVNRCWFDWFAAAADAAAWLCIVDTMLALAPDPKPIIVLPLEPTPGLPAAAAAEAANNNGFDAMATSRWLLADDCCMELSPFGFALFEQAKEGLIRKRLFIKWRNVVVSCAYVFEDVDTGCGRRGSRSSCCRAAYIRKFKKMHERCIGNGSSRNSKKKTYWNLLPFHLYLHLQLL